MKVVLFCVQITARDIFAFCLWEWSTVTTNKDLHWPSMTWAQHEITQLTAWNTHCCFLFNDFCVPLYGVLECRESCLQIKRVIICLTAEATIAAHPPGLFQSQAFFFVGYAHALAPSPRTSLWCVQDAYQRSVDELRAAQKRSTSAGGLYEPL